MRIFIAIDIPEYVKKEIVKIQKNLPGFVGKKTEPENLHLTLKFLGEIDGEKVEQVKERLRKVKFGKFEVEVDCIGVFSEKFVRIVWVHLTNCEQIQRVVDEALADIFEKEKRFMGHLTIARVKSLKDKKEFLQKLGEIEFPKIKFDVGEFCLKESVLKPSGAEYRNLEFYK